MAAPEPEIRTFIKRLTLGTKEGKVKWTPKNDRWFELHIAGVSVVVRSESPAGDEHPYMFEMSKESGDRLSHASTIPGNRYSDWEDEIEDLFKAARNSAFEIDKTLSELSSELDLPDLPASADDIRF